MRYLMFAVREVVPSVTSLALCVHALILGLQRNHTSNRYKVSTGLETTTAY